MLEACMTPDLIVEITLQPVRRYGVDAAIFFSDIVLPLKAMGVDLDIVPGVGPVIAAADRATSRTSRRFRTSTRRRSTFVTEAVAALTAELGGDAADRVRRRARTRWRRTSIEGGPSKDHAKTKAMMHGAPEVWDALLTKLAVIAAGFLRVQVEAGASAVQLFDSWAGGLAPADYRAHVLPHSSAVFAAIADLGVPRIHFGVGTGEILTDMAAAGVEVWASTGGCRSTGRLTPDPAGPGGAGQPRLDRGLRAVGGHRGQGPRRDRARPRRRRATSSTSATACCRPPTPTCWPGSSSSFTRSTDVARR